MSHPYGCDCGATVEDVVDMGESAHAFWCSAVDGNPAAEAMRREHEAKPPCGVRYVDPPPEMFGLPQGGAE